MWRETQIDLLHRDAPRNRADKITEIAADAFRFIDARDTAEGRGVRFAAVYRRSVVEFGDGCYGDDFPALRFAPGRSGVSVVVTGRSLRDWAYPVHVDALVSAVPAGRIAKLAPDAFLLLDAGDDFVVEVEMLPLSELGEG